MSMVSLKEQLDNLKADYNKKLGERKSIELYINNLEQSINQSKREIAELESLNIIYQETAEEARRSYAERLAESVTTALQHVFGPDFKFEIELTESRGRPEAEFYVMHEHDGQILRNRPKDAMGGGVVDIVSVALQIALKQLYQDPSQRGPLILDEPGKHVSEEYAIKLGMFLNEASKVFDMQVIMNTHQRYLADQATKTYLMEIRNGQSVISETSELDTALQLLEGVVFNG